MTPAEKIMREALEKARDCLSGQVLYQRRMVEVVGRIEGKMVPTYAKDTLDFIEDALKRADEEAKEYREWRHHVEMHLKSRQAQGDNRE